MKVTMDIQGLEGTLQTLQSLPPEVVSKRGGPVKLALAKAARVIRDQARQNVTAGVSARGNRSTGLLAKNIIVTRGRKGPMGSEGERYLVRVKPKVAKYANNRRNVRSGRAGKLYLAEGPAFYGRFLEYGTSKMPAYPWLRPTVKQKGQEAIKVFTSDLNRRIDATVKKLAQQNQGK